MKVEGLLPITNTISLNIYKFEHGIDDYVWAGLNNEKPRKYKMYSSSKGYYFKYKGFRYYLHEFQRG